MTHVFKDVIFCSYQFFAIQGIIFFHHELVKKDFVLFDPRAIGNLEITQNLIELAVLRKARLSHLGL
jgi:hypothetical protein